MFRCTSICESPNVAANPRTIRVVCSEPPRTAAISTDEIGCYSIDSVGHAGDSKVDDSSTDNSPSGLSSFGSLRNK